MGRSSRSAVWVVGSCLFALAAAASPQRSPEAGVVLLINTRLDGSLVYGAGVVLDESGKVTTSAQLVGRSFSLWALPFDARRVRGLPPEGDLARFIYEHRRHLVPARLVRSNPAADLALLQLKTQRPLRRASFARGPLEPGEQIFALGHGEQEVWAAAPVRVLRADAASVQYEQGGDASRWGSPLLNARGEVVAMAVQAPDGKHGLARPAALLRDLAGNLGSPQQLDLSTPERGFFSCAQALQAGSTEYLRCVDWESRQRVVVDAFVRDAQRRGVPEEKISALLPELAKARPQLLEAQKRIVLAQLRGEDAESAVAFRPDAWTSGIKLKPAPEMDPQELRYRMELAERGGREGSLEEPPSALPLQALARLGLQVSAIHQPSSDRAWLLVSSSQASGSEVRFSQLLLLRGGEWLQCDYPSVEETASLPSGWPEPLSNLERIVSLILDAGESPSGD